MLSRGDVKGESTEPFIAQDQVILEPEIARKITLSPLFNFHLLIDDKFVLPDVCHVKLFLNLFFL